MSDTPDTVLLVDDEKSILDVLSMGFKRAGIPVKTALTAEDAIVLLEVEKFGAVVTDKNLPGKSGLELLKIISERYEHCARVVITGFVNTESVLEAMRLGADDYLLKPFESIMLVVERVKQAMKHRKVQMERQALEIASWGRNVFVKVPVTNTEGTFCGPLIGRLARAGVQVNVTAILTLTQVIRVVGCLESTVPAFVSVFAGRIADTGRDPIPIMSRSVAILRDLPRVDLIWASPREVLNVFQANEIGCHVITATADILAKLSLAGKDLDIYSLETVRMFRQDALDANYAIETPTPVASLAVSGTHLRKAGARHSRRVRSFD